MGTLNDLLSEEPVLENLAVGDRCDRRMGTRWARD